MTKIVNLFGGPGCGKSTTAADLFYLLKITGKSVELVTEYAKDMVWEDRKNIMADQIYMFAKQRRRIDRLVGKVDFVITDSPLPLGIVYQQFYSKKETPWEQAFIDLVFECFETYDNVKYYLPRVVPYEKVGREQNLEEAVALDNAIKDLIFGNLTYVKELDPNITFKLQIFKDLQ